MKQLLGLIIQSKHSRAAKTLFFSWDKTKTKEKTKVCLSDVFFSLPLSAFRFRFHFSHFNLSTHPVSTTSKHFPFSTPSLSLDSFSLLPPAPSFNSSKQENEQTAQTAFRPYKYCFMHSSYNLPNLCCYHNPYRLLHCFQA